VIVRSLLAETLADALKQRHIARLAYLPDLQRMLCGAVLPAMVKSARFAVMDIKQRAKMLSQRTSANAFSNTLFVPKYSSAADGDVTARNVLTEDFAPEETEEYSICFDSLRIRCSLILASLAAACPALVLEQLGRSFAHVCGQVAGGADPDMPVPYGGCSAASTPARLLDAAILASESVAAALPNDLFQALQHPQPQPGEDAQRHAERVAELATAARHLQNICNGLLAIEPPDPLLRGRVCAALASFHRYFGCAETPNPAIPGGATLLPALLTNLFGTLEYQVPARLIQRADAASASQPSGAAKMAVIGTARATEMTVARAILEDDAQLARQRACGALVFLSRCVPVQLLPALQAMTGRIIALLSGGTLEPQDQVCLYEVLVLVSNALSTTDASAHASFVEQLLGHVMGEWTSPEVTAAFEGPESLLRFLGLLNPPAPADAGASVSAAVESRVGKAKALLHTLHIIWAVARRVTYGATASPGKDANSSTCAHPFHSYWPRILPNILRLLNCLFALWNPAAMTALCPPVSSTGACAGIAVEARYLLAMSREEVTIQTRAAGARRGPASEGAAGGDMNASFVDEDEDSDDERAPGASKKGKGTSGPEMSLVPVWSAEAKTVVYVPVALSPESVQVGDFLAAWSARSVWHSLSILGFCIKASSPLVKLDSAYAGGTRAAADLAAIGGSQAPAVPPQAIPSVGFLHSSLQSTWPLFQSLLSHQTASALPARVHNIVVQQIYPQVYALCSGMAAPAISPQVLQFMLSTTGAFVSVATKAALRDKNGGSSSGGMGANTAVLPDAGLLLPSTAAMDAHVIDAMGEKLRRDSQRALIETIERAVGPARDFLVEEEVRIKKMAEDDRAAKEATATAMGVPFHSGSLTVFPPARSFAFTPLRRALFEEPETSAAMAAVLTHCLGNDAIGIRKVCLSWSVILPMIADATVSPPHVPLATAWVSAAATFFQTVVESYCMKKYPEVEDLLLTAIIEIYSTLMHGYSVGDRASIQAAMTGASRVISEAPRAFLASLLQPAAASLGVANGGASGMAELAKFDAATKDASIQERDRRLAAKSVLQCVASIHAPTAEDSKSKKRVKDLPEKLRLLNRVTGGAGSSTVVESNPLDEAALGSLFGTGGDL
jgi:hypothetical protein